MAFPREELALKFLRTYSRIFTLKEMKKVLNSVGIPADLDETREFLENSPNVIELEKNRFITRSGAFTGEIFSVVPTSEEFEQKVFVPGDRCMPFVESDRISSTLSFYINGKKIPRREGCFDSDSAIDMFMFFGEEYASQYIAADPANRDLDLVNREFELPNKVRLTGIDLEFLEKNYGYMKGDRFLCCVNNWDEGKINMMILHPGKNKFNHGEVGEKRLEWFAHLEKLFLESFDRFGPLGTIEDQVVRVFFENRRSLCVPYCGSIEEFVNIYSKKIAFEHYGVETRLWHKGEEVPAFGNWNKAMFDNASDRGIPFETYVFQMIPDFVLDLVVLDCLFRKDGEPCKRLVEMVTRDEFVPDSEVVASLSLNLTERFGILSKEYNWFADQALGLLRQKTLDLYFRVFVLVHKVDCAGSSVVDFPSQDVVVLAQLHGHLVRMLESIAGDPSAEDSKDAMLLSLEGMEWNFEDIRSSVEEALARSERSRFKIIRQPEN